MPTDPDEQVRDVNYYAECTQDWLWPFQIFLEAEPYQ